MVILLTLTEELIKISERRKSTRRVATMKEDLLIIVGIKIN